MSDQFKLEIVNPEKSFLLKDDVTEVIIPAYEGEMGILKDHISLISFLKPGLIKIFSKGAEDRFFVEDGIVEFKDNNLTILTSSISNINEMKKDRIDTILSEAEKNSQDKEISDQQKYLADQKIEVLKSIN
jgi:F-type H+-transporting ATPase subunit epsilon|tara:strand:- start:1086 stop:1478 length:393 start_codon:yes stop_codon:yes gene_type:complete